MAGRPSGCKIGGLLLLVCSLDLIAEEVEFDPSLLAPSPHAADISRFNKGQVLLAGNYDSDIYLNEQLLGRHTIRLKDKKHTEGIVLCLDPELLQLTRIKPKAISSELAGQLAHADTCVEPNALSPDIHWHYSTTQLALHLSIPQSLLISTRQSTVDPSQWQQGENMASVGYDLNSYHSDTPKQSYSSVYLGIQTHANLDAWRLHHHSNMQNGHWQANDTYLQRSLPDWRSRLTLGQTWTHGDFFDSVGYLGMNITTDPQMLPEFERGFAPVVRGIARTQARVRIEQNGVLVYELTVAPGPFAIDDFYPAGYSGDLQVTVLEADGSQQQFTIPYASVPRMVREDVTFYDSSLGWLRNQQTFEPDQPLGQLTLQHGFNNLLTGYTGATLIPDYAAGVLGVGLNTRVGAISFDITHSRLDDPVQDLQEGDSYRVTYSRLLTATHTNLTLANYRYSNQDYYSLSEAVQKRYQSSGPQYGYEHSKQRLDINISQPLGGERGELYLAWGRNYYWQQPGYTDNWQLGYGNRISNISYQLSAQQSQEAGTASNTSASLSLSMPLGNSSLPNYLQLQLSHDPNNGDGIQGSLSGALGDKDQLNYNLYASQRNNRYETDQHSLGLSGSYNASKVYLSANSSYDSQYNRQYGLGVRGALVAFEQGILTTRDIGDTYAIISAPFATGASLSNWQDITIDENGYAVAPYLSPFITNQIALAPGEMATSVELVNSAQVVTPDAGASLKVNFTTRRGYSLLVRGQLANGTPLPFGADILSVWGEPLGIVGQGGLLYAKVSTAKSYVIVRWGEQECLLPYQITGDLNKPLRQETKTVICGGNGLSSQNEIRSISK